MHVLQDSSPDGRVMYCCNVPHAYHTGPTLCSNFYAGCCHAAGVEVPIVQNIESHLPIQAWFFTYIRIIMSHLKTTEIVLVLLVPVWCPGGVVRKFVL